MISCLIQGPPSRVPLMFLWIRKDQRTRNGERLESHPCVIRFLFQNQNANKNYNEVYKTIFFSWNLLKLVTSFLIWFILSSTVTYFSLLFRSRLVIRRLYPVFQLPITYGTI